MKTWLKFLISILVIVLLSAILAPILFKFLPYKFERIFNRLMMIGTLGAVLLFVRVRRETFQAYGLLWQGKTSLRYFTVGFWVALITMLLLATLKFVFGFLVWSPKEMTALEFITKIIYVFGAGVLIGVIEEFFFRGFVFRTLSNKLFLPQGVSVLITSVFYSLIHFVSYKQIFIGPEPTFLDSLKLMITPFISIMSFPLFWNEAFGLFLFGVILNLIAIRAGALYPGIGIHAGCVFFSKLDGSFLNELSKNNYLYTSGKMYDGLWGWVFLTMMGCVLYRFWGDRTKGVLP